MSIPTDEKIQVFELSAPRPVKTHYVRQLISVPLHLIESANVLFSRTFEGSDIYTCMAPATYNLIAWNQFFFTKDTDGSILPFPENQCEAFENMLIEEGR